MTNSKPSSLPSPPIWQAEKHLQSGDRIWILTDVQSYGSSYYPWSDPQALFRIGVYDLRTRKVGLANFGRDLAFALLKASLPPPPWKMPLPCGVAIHRVGHDHEPKGRYLVSVKPVPIEPEWYSVLPGAMRMFFQTAHCANSELGMWDDLVARAARENAIESVALRKTVPFSAGDIRTAIGDPEAEVTSVLQKLVDDGKLLVSGQKRGTRYRLA